MIILYIIIILNTIFGQIRPYEEPKYINNQKYTLKEYELNNINNVLKLKVKKGLSHHLIKLTDKKLYTININNKDNNLTFFLIDLDRFAFNGPYTNNDLITDPINSKNIILEIINKDPNDIIIDIDIKEHNHNFKQNSQKKYNYTNRENPIILVTGYWPPTNEMIRHFSQDTNLNPNGWQGENWENSGYDIVSYFPTFDDPNCTSCGQGNGILQVDYQNTSEDFWPIANSHTPIGIVTFSRGFNNLSWELEYNAYNRTNWYNDYETPFLPTPNPPDQDEAAFYLRNSNLPMEEIIVSIDNLGLGLDPYIDSAGDPGRFVSEFMAYHGTWYRDLNLSSDLKCIAAGHVHVGGQIDTDIAKLAANQTIRELIKYLDESIYILGDANLDNIIDVLDLVLIINNILGNAEFSTTQFLASDINQDGIINIQDIILVVNMILNN